ncbi:MAG: glycosyltransferase [Agriterribacter sp.]
MRHLSSFRQPYSNPYLSFPYPIEIPEPSKANRMKPLPKSSHQLTARNYRPRLEDTYHLSSDHIPEVAVVMPLYNPGSNWKETFAEHASKLEAAIAGNAKLKYILVNDGSIVDPPHKELKELTEFMNNVSYISYEKNQGKGYALRKGLSVSDCRYTVMTDIDFPYACDNITTIIALLLHGYEVVAGVRDKIYFNHLPFKRKVISKSFISCNKILFSLPIHDTQAGIKGLGPKGKAAFMETKINRFLADTEFMMLVKKQRLSFKSVPLRLRPGVVFSDFGSSTIIAECRNFFHLVKMKCKRNK